MKQLLLLLFVLMVKVSVAQVFIEYAPIGGAAAGEYNFYGTSTLPTGIPYTRIRGSAFWKDEFKLASFYDGKRRFCILPAKINLATQEVHYLLNEKELVVKPENGISAVVFHKGNDTSQMETAFIKAMSGVYLKDQPLSGFLQVMNSGTYKLLKLVQRSVNSADSLFGTQKRYFFKDDYYYFVQNGEMVNAVKKLNEESFLSLFPHSSSYRTWIKEQKLNFKKEVDLLRFLAHYNANTAFTPK